MKQEFLQYPEVTAHHKHKAAAWSQAEVCDFAWSHMRRTTRTGLVVGLGRKQGLHTSAGSPSHHAWIGEQYSCVLCLPSPPRGGKLKLVCKLKPLRRKIPIPHFYQSRELKVTLRTWQCSELGFLTAKSGLFGYPLASSRSCPNASILCGMLLPTDELK